MELRNRARRWRLRPLFAKVNPRMLEVLFVKARSSLPMSRVMFIIVVALLSGCARFQPTTPGTNYGPTATIQSVTLKDTSVHYDPNILRPGVQRSTVQAKFGDPNDSATGQNGLVVDTYAFYPDGTKFVNPTVRPRNIALGFFTAGTSVVVRQLRLAQTEKKLTLYHITYGGDGAIISVKVEPPKDANSASPTGSPVPPANNVE
jgi:hypothetical protein